MTTVTNSETRPGAAAPSPAAWQSFWHGHSVDSEIAMADFYGLRHVLLKFLPRHGTAVEAGCGLARYVFYLRALGLRALGCDGLLPALGTARRWAQRAQPESAEAFTVGDVRRLPCGDGRLSGYISLGVVEHFPEGPDGAIAEAFRVLRPGGIAIIDVPSAQAFDVYVHRTKRALGALVGRPGPRGTGLYEQPLAPAALGAALVRAGFTLLFCGGSDVIYPAWSLGVSPRWYGALHRAETTWVRRWGGLAVAVGMKPGTPLACFVCGDVGAVCADVAVPFCEHCRAALPADVLAAYTPEQIGTVRWQQLDCGRRPVVGPCTVCGGSWTPDPHFGDWGFTAAVCRACVRQPMVNLTLAQRALKRVWRPRVPRQRAVPEPAEVG